MESILFFALTEISGSRKHTRLLGLDALYGAILAARLKGMAPCQWHSWAVRGVDPKKTQKLVSLPSTLLSPR